MCLAVPLQVAIIHKDGTASVKQGDSFLNVDISLLEEVSEDDFVIVHAGYAIEVLDIDEAQVRLDMFDSLESGNGH